MKPEIAQLLQQADKEHLFSLVQELIEQHPALEAEVASYLAQREGSGNDAEDTIDSDEEVSEDWDFSGDEQIVFHPYPQPTQFPLDALARRQQLEEFTQQLDFETVPQVVMETLSRLIDEAISYVGQGDSNGALELFALMFEQRLREARPDLVPVYDEMIDAAMYTLETLLSEASSNALLDAEHETLTPLLNPSERHRWLERLFALWLKRLDVHRMEEDLPEIILDVAWSEDILLLRSLVQNELQKQPHSEHSNIVDFTRQYRTKALEKFLKELPRT
jgi:hypothetical protein